MSAQTFYKRPKERNHVAQGLIGKRLVDKLLDQRNTTSKSRHRYTEEEKSQIVNEAMQPGSAFSGTARKYGISAVSLWSWRKSLFGSAQNGLSQPLEDADHTLALARKIQILEREVKILDRRLIAEQARFAAIVAVLKASTLHLNELVRQEDIACAAPKRRTREND